MLKFSLRLQKEWQWRAVLKNSFYCKNELFMCCLHSLQEFECVLAVLTRKRLYRKPFTTGKFSQFSLFPLFLCHYQYYYHYLCWFAFYTSTLFWLLSTQFVDCAQILMWLLEGLLFFNLLGSPTVNEIILILNRVS